MADIERRAFEVMTANGGTPVQRVYTAGGGARNPVWTALRSNAIGVPVTSSPNGAHPAHEIASGLRRRCLRHDLMTTRPG